MDISDLPEILPIHGLTDDQQPQWLVDGFKVTRERMVAVQEHLNCPKCAAGHLTPTGRISPVQPTPGIWHRCGECGSIFVLPDVRFPRVIFVPADSPLGKQVEGRS
jgi:hypothetical protein